MQLHALNKDNRLIHVKKADRQEDFKCIECGDSVKLRGGIQRQLHFYHVNTNRHCRQNGKSLEHLQVQNYITDHFLEGECFLEHKFPEINRIADVALIKEKIVFEIQCSPISSKEVSERNKDYKTLGWEVVWILHDCTFNQFKMTSAETFLLNQTHYFTNINKKGEGFIYDQFDILSLSFRRHKQNPLPIQINKFIRKEQFIQTNRYFLLNVVNKRISCWSFSFERDLIHTNLTGKLDEYLQKARNIENNKKREISNFYFIKTNNVVIFLYSFFKSQLTLFLRFILEKSCK